MNRSSALRSFLIFATLALIAAVTGFLSEAAIAEALFLIGASVAAMMLFLSTGQRPAELKPIPIRIRR